MNRYIFILLQLSALICPSWLSVGWADPAFRQVVGDYPLSYPRDHGAHPEFETEWWYTTGHLRTEDGNTYGFELVFFRIGVDPDRKSASAWAVESLYLAHFAFTDDAADTFEHCERRNRGNFAQAGALTDRLKSWNGDWQMELEDGILKLRASSGTTELELALRSKKPLVLHGKDGLSQKGPGEGQASYYSSFTRLQGEGSLKRNGTSLKVQSASVWLDQEFTSSKLARGTQGWDWFALQLDTGEELMLYYLREADGERSAFSSGTFVSADGKTEQLTLDEFSITPLAEWKSPETGIRYPSRWRIEVPRLKIKVEIIPSVAHQELTTKASTGVTYWEGRSQVVGTQGAAPLTGDAYVELVGYK